MQAGHSARGKVARELSDLTIEDVALADAADDGLLVVVLVEVGDQGLGREHQAGDAGRVAERGPHDLHRVDDAGLDMSTYSPVLAS